MKDDVIIRHVLLVIVPLPIGSIDMYFHVAGPLGAGNAHTRIKEIRPRIGVMDTGSQHLHGFPALGKQFLIIEQPEFPDVVQKVFSHTVIECVLQ